MIDEKNIPLISIIIPVHNTEAYLKQCIESVLTQTFSKFELILIDDGSKDHSGDICDEYAQKDPRVIVVHQMNKGTTEARKIGVEKAIGLYVMFLDSDDYYEQGILKHIDKIQEKYSVDAIIFNGVRFDKNGIKKRYKCSLNEGIYNGGSIKKIHKNLILDDKDRIGIYYGVCMKVFLRTLYNRFQETVPKELYKGEDLAVSAPLLSVCKSVYVLNFCGYYYRDTPGSIMNSFYHNELVQIKILANYLEDKMDSFYISRIDAYVVMHLFDYIDRMMVSNKSYSAYRKEVRKVTNKEFMMRIKRVQSHSTHFNERLLFFLFKHRLFTLLWIFRKIKKRRQIPYVREKISIDE